MTRITELPAKIIGMSNEEYRGEKKFDSRSTIHSIHKFGGEAQMWIDTGKSLWGGNSSTAKGSEFDAIITGILEGKRFEDLVVVPPDEVLGANGSRSTKAYKEWAASQTGVCVTADQRDQYAKMLDAMRGNDSCYELMTLTVETQVSVFFEHEGHLLKTRPDACTKSMWWDLKTTSQSWDKVYRSVIDYGYAEQEWLYVLSAMAIGMPHFRMPFVFVQTTPPYGCRVFYLPEQMVENAGRAMLNTLEQMRLRRSTGHYMPADAGEIQELFIPNWAMKEEEVVEL